MNDADFLHAFETGQLIHFHHRDHVRLAWVLLRAFGWEAGCARLRTGLRHVALAHGMPSRYHETLTLFWAHVVQHAMAAAPEHDTFERFIAAYPFLLDARLPSHHYSDAVLGSDAARAKWLEPDVLPLPSLRAG